jgi:hypothetical protein
LSRLPLKLPDFVDITSEEVAVGAPADIEYAVAAGAGVDHQVTSPGNREQYPALKLERLGVRVTLLRLLLGPDIGDAVIAPYPLRAPRPVVRRIEIDEGGLRLAGLPPVSRRAGRRPW